MRRAQAALLRSLLQRGVLQADGAQGLAVCAPAVSSLQAALQTSQPSAYLSRYHDNACCVHAVHRVHCNVSKNALAGAAGHSPQRRSRRTSRRG